MMFFISGCPSMAQLQHRTGSRPHRSGQPQADLELRQEDDRDESAVPRACCDTVNRGASYADGKLVLRHARRLRDRSRRADRQGSLGRQARLAGEGRDHHLRSAHRREPRHHRLRRRRVRCPRSRDGLQPRRRQEGLGVPLDRFRQGRLPRRRDQQGQPALRHGRLPTSASRRSPARTGRSAAARLGAGTATIRSSSSSTTRPATPVCGARSTAAPTRRTRSATRARSTTSGR